MLEAVTKDQLNIGLTGQIRYRPAERNLYAYFFGVKNPIVHVMGYFVAILRQRIASFEAQAPRLIDEDEIDAGLIGGISINDLRKNLNEINDYMEQECASSAARYGVELDASLITGIDPPHEVDSALAAINTAHNEVSADISLAKAEADQTIVQSKRAVEIETLRAEAEVEPLNAWPSSCVPAGQRPGRAGRLSAQRAAGALRSGPAHPGGGAKMNNFLILLHRRHGLLRGFPASLEPILRGLLRFFGVYAVVEEGTCHVYVLFGKVVAVFDEPGLQCCG